MAREEKTLDFENVIVTLLLSLFSKFLNQMEKGIEGKPQPRSFLQEVIDGGIDIHISCCNGLTH